MLDEQTLLSINATMNQESCDWKVQIINKSLRQRLGDKDCYMCDISDGVHYMAAFFVVKPSVRVEVHAFFRIRSYHAEMVPGRKIVVDEYEYDGCMESAVGNPHMLDVQNPTEIAKSASLPEQVYEEDGCVDYDKVIIGTATSVSICGRLLASAVEKGYSKKDGSGRGVLVSCMMFHKGKSAKITTFNNAAQSILRGMKPGDCLLIRNFKAEVPSKFDEGTTLSILIDQNTTVKTLDPIHPIDVIHRIDADVMPDVSADHPRYVTLVVQITECNEVTQTKNGKDMRRLALRDGGRNSIQVTLFGELAKRPFVQNGIMVLANVKVEYNEYDHAQTINISPYTSMILMEDDAGDCGEVIEERIKALKSGLGDDNNGGLPEGEPDRYGVHPPLIS